MLSNQFAYKVKKTDVKFNCYKKRSKNISKISVDVKDILYGENHKEPLKPYMCLT